MVIYWGTITLWLQTRAPSGEQELPTECHVLAQAWSPVALLLLLASEEFATVPVARELAPQRSPGLGFQRRTLSAHTAPEAQAAGARLPLGNAAV